MFNLFNNEYILIILSIIWGFGLSCIFRKICNGRNCIMYKAPNPNSIINKIWKDNNKCYVFKTKQVKCTSNSII